MQASAVAACRDCGASVRVPSADRTATCSACGSAVAVDDEHDFTRDVTDVDGDRNQGAIDGFDAAWSPAGEDALRRSSIPTSRTD